MLNTDQGANTIGATGVLGTAGQPGTFTTLGTITAQLSTSTGAVVNMGLSNFRIGGESRFNGTTFNGTVAITDFGGFGTWRGLRVISNTFNGVVDITNSITAAGGSGNTFGFSGNTFNADAMITCNATQTGISIGDANSWFPAATSPREIFNANLTLNISTTATQAITIDGGTTTTTVAGNLTVNCNGGFGEVNINNLSVMGASAFNLINLTTGQGVQIAQGSGRAATFNGNVTINNTGSTINELFRFARLGNVTFNGNISISSTGGASGSRRIRLGDDETQAGTITLAANRTITATGVQVGELHIQKITQASGTNTHTHNLSTATAVSLQLNRNTLHGNLTATGNRMQFRRNVIGSSAANVHILSHAGTAGSDNGGNTFKGSMTMNFEKTLASGASSLSWTWGWNDASSNGGPDVFENDVTVNVNVTGVSNNLNNGTANGGLIAFANNTTGTAFNTVSGQTIFNLNNTASAIHLARNANTAATVHGQLMATAAATNNGNMTWDGNTRGALQIAFGTGSVVTFKSNVILNNQSTTDLSCCGRNQFSLAASGTVHFEGNVTFNGSGLSAYNFANATAAATTTRGLLLFREGLEQTISSNIASLDLVRVQINKSANNVTLANNSIRVSNELILTTKNLVLGNNDLFLHTSATMPVNATLTDGGAGSYLVASGTGRLFRRVEAVNVLFPVGTASAYMPFTVNNAGTADQFGVRMADLSAAPYSISSYFTNHGWDVAEGTAGGSNSTITGQWNAGNEQTNFNRAQSAFYRWNGTQFNCLQAEAAAGGAGPYTRSVAALGATNSVGVFAPATAFADAYTSDPNVMNQTSCGGFNLAANVNPFTGPGAWSVVSQPGGSPAVTFADAASPTSLVSGLVTGAYVLRWITASGCTNRTSDVTINFTQTSLTPVATCVWTGDANNGNWADCTNWTGSVPGEVSTGVWSNVTIPGGLTTMYPVLAANVTVGNLTLSAGANINLANFTLESRGVTAVAGSTVTSNGGILLKNSTSNDTWAGGNTFSGNLTIRHSGAGGTLTLSSTTGNTFASTATNGIADHTYTFDIAHAAADIVLGTGSITQTVIGNLAFASIRNTDFQVGNLSLGTNIHSTLRATGLQTGRRAVMGNYTINRGSTLTTTFYGLHTVSNTMTLTSGRTLLADGANLLLDNISPSAIVGVTGPTHDEREIMVGDINNQTTLAGTGTFSWRCAPNASAYVFPVGTGNWNSGNSRWGRMAAFSFVVQSGTDVVTVQSVGNTTPAASYSLTNARSGSINNEHVNWQWIVTCADAASNLQIANVGVPWRQYGPWDNFEQANFTPARSRSGLVRYHHGNSRWECIMPVGTPSTLMTDRYSHTATTSLGKTSPLNLGVFAIASVTADVSLTATTQATACRTISLNASNNLTGSPATGQWANLVGVL